MAKTTYESGFSTTLTAKLAAADVTMSVATAPTVTSGRLFLKSGTTKEWISYTGVSGTTLTGLTRGLSQTADPSTSGTGLDWIAGTKVVLVAMHDQLLDVQTGEQALLEAKRYATTTARDSALGGDGVATKAYTGIVCDDTGDEYKYNLVTAQWETVDTGTPTPNATTTAAGKVELATQAEMDAGTATGGTGASLVATPDLIQAYIDGNVGDFIVSTGYKAGEAIDGSSVGKLLTRGSTYLSYQFATSAAGTRVTIGNTASTEKRAVPYWSNGDTGIDAITTYLSKVGSPADNLTIRVETDSGFAPSGTLADANATFSKAGGTISGTSTEYTLSAAGAFNLTADTLYWIVIGRSGAVDAGNYFFIVSGSTYSRGQVYSSSTWIDDTSTGQPSVVFEISSSQVQDQIRVWLSPAEGGAAYYSGYTAGTYSTGDVVDAVKFTGYVSYTGLSIGGVYGMAAGGLTSISATNKLIHPLTSSIAVLHNPWN